MDGLMIFDSDSLTTLQKELIQLVTQTRQGILNIYNDKARWQIEQKDDNSPLTAADRYIHQHLVEGLNELNIANNIPILSEEGDMPAWSERQTWSYYWIIDPLDGTKEFINRTGEFTVNIALIKQHQPILSVVYIPVEDTLYSAIKDQGSLRITEEEQEKIYCKPLESPAKILASRSHRGAKTDKWLTQYEQIFGEYEVVSAGSSLKFCRIAEGAADIYPRLGLTSEWDTAAAQLIVEEAGGRVFDASGKCMAYNTKDDILNPHFLVVADPEQDWQLLIEKL